MSFDIKKNLMFKKKEIKILRRLILLKKIMLKFLFKNPQIKK